VTDLHVDAFGAGTPALFVHGSMSRGLDTFPEQQQRADQYKVMLIDRRGFGGSPPTKRADYEVDAQDVVDVLADGSHLVGQSYGAVVGLLAASRRPESVLSLTLIEPFAWVDDEAARAYHARLVHVVAQTAELALRSSGVEWARAGGRRDIELPAFTQSDLAAITTTMRERTPWGAEIPLAPVASAAFPKLVCLGGRSDADPNVKRTAGRAYAALCRAIAERIGADLQVFEHSSHNPQIEEAPAFNQRLRKLWGKSAGSAISSTPSAAQPNH